MSERDDKLEQKIQSLEEGEPVERLMEGDDISDELSSLINLAASIRDLPHPELDRQTIQSEKHRIISATRDRNRANQRRQGSKVGGFTGQWLFVPAAAGLALILLMVFVLSAGAGIYFAGPRGAHTATLTDAKGTLQVSDSGVSGDWHAVSNGDKVRAGQRVRTAADSWVTLEFFEGTQTTLAPNTDLMLENIDGQWGNVLQVELIQNTGQTEHGVVPLRGEKAAFNVYTPSGTASVKGTNFKVLVDESGKSTFQVDIGKVLVTNNGSQAYVMAGQGLATVLGEPLSTPGYLFVVQGELTSKVEGVWTVAGVNIIVPEEAQIIGNPKLFKNVFVQGQIQDQYDWIADSIRPAFSNDQAGTFTGFVTAVSEDRLAWQVNGVDFIIDGEAQVDEEIQTGDAVRVAFVVLEGGDWQVVRIDSLEGEDEEDVSPLDMDPDADAPSEEDLPSDDGVSCTGADPHPKADKLFDDYSEAAVSDGTELTRLVTYDDIMGWFCNDRLGFGEIELAFKLSESSELLVDEIIELRLGGQGWGEIKQFLADTDDEDDDDELEVNEGLSFEEDEFEASACDSVPTFTTTLTYKPGGDDPSTLEVTLDFDPEAVTGDVKEILVEPAESFTMDTGDTVDVTVTITLKGDLIGLPEDSEVKIRVFTTSEVEDVELKIELKCDAEPEEGEDEEQDDDVTCTGNEEHPKALKLEKEYADNEFVEVSYNDIMTWFCVLHYGFGEIDLMLGLSEQYRVDVEVVIIPMRQGGLGWGQIKQQLAANDPDNEEYKNPAGKVPPGKIKSEEKKDKVKPNKKDDD